MSHFESDQDALVVGSYVDLCYAHVSSSDSARQYKLYEICILQDNGTGRTVAWYHEHQLTKIPGPHGKRFLNSFLRVPFD